ncbi:MAG: alpha/beta fold hydrolase [Terracidiphilus sp.]
MAFLRKTFSAALVTIFAWLLLCAIAGIVAAEWALHPPRRALAADDRRRAAATAQNHSAILRQVQVTADDGAILWAWQIVPQSANGDAVILLHGIADNRAGMLGPAEMLLRHGYSVLLPDARAQGVSGGTLATYGFLEAGDLKDWFNWLLAQQVPHCIYAVGESMGAAQLLISLRIDRGFCAVVAESSFASFREASYVRIGEWFGSGPWLGRTLLRPVVETGILYARWRYGADLNKANPAQAVAASHIPVLLIHGRADKNMPPYNSETILAASQGHNPGVSLWEPANAGHCGAMGAEPAEFESRVVGWFRSHRIPAQ